MIKKQLIDFYFIFFLSNSSCISFNSIFSLENCLQTEQQKHLKLTQEKQIDCIVD